MLEYPLRFGYACINAELRDYDVFTSRTPILNTIKKKGPEYLQNEISNNVDDLLKILIYNEAHGIRFYRISSCVFPHLGNPKLLNADYSLDFVKAKLKIIGKYAKDHGHRLTMHPGQFAQLGSEREDVIKQTFTDLINHAKLLEMMGFKPTDGSVLIIHGGGTFGNKAETLKRWEKNFNLLPKNVRLYISLENDENGYSVMDLLPFCEKLGIPMCLDIFHNRVSKDRVHITYALLSRIFATWHSHGSIPKLHFSNQQPGLRRGAHSKTIYKFPRYLITIPQVLKIPLDVMLEVKDKEISVFRLYYKYFDINMDANGRVYYTLKDKYIEKIDN